jgi:hypothetical protein
MPLVDLQKFLNDLVHDSPHVGRARTAQEATDPLINAHSTFYLLLKGLRDFSEVKDLVEDVRDCGK